MSKKTSQGDTGHRAVTRRDFIAAIGGLGVGAVLAGTGASVLLQTDEVYAIEASDGYLLVDTKKCGGCETCMLVCTLAHCGRSNVNLSRLQLTKNPLGHFPLDLAQNQCRQCPYPSCVEACPTKAMHVDPESHVRLVDEDKCVGCERCIEACPLGLSPVEIAGAYTQGDAARLDKLMVDLCMGCGCCTFVCPAKRPVAQTMSLAKAMQRKAGK